MSFGRDQSARSAAMGSTRVARSAGTQHARSATAKSAAARFREAAKRALALAPDRPEAYHALGDYQLRVALDSNRAIEQYARGLRLAPDNAELLTESKMFCGCQNAFGGEPNTRCCPVCLGMPGSLPVMNRRAVEHVIRTALALNCEITRNAKYVQDHWMRLRLHLVPFFGDKIVSEITPGLVQEYRVHRATSRKHPTTGDPIRPSRTTLLRDSYRPAPSTRT